MSKADPGVQTPTETKDLIGISERMVDYLDRQFPEVEKAAKQGVSEAEALKTELTAQRALISNLEAKLRQEDQAGEDKAFRSNTPFEMQCLRAVGEVIVDSYRAFRSGYRNIPDKYKTARRDAAQIEETDSLGGITVPTLTYQNVAYLQREKTLGRELCFTFPMVTDKMDVPAVDSGTPGAYFVANGNAPTGSAITFLTNKQMVTKTLMATNLVEGELIEDTVIAYQTFWAQVFLDQFSLKENLAVFSMTANDPDAATSAFTGAVQAVIAAGNTQNIIATSGTHFSTVSYDNLVAAQNAIDAGCREGAVWVMNKAAFRYIQALRDTNGFPILSSMYSALPAISTIASPPLGKPTMLMGDPCYITEAMPGHTKTAASGTAMVLYGNFKKGHYFGDRMQLAIQWSSEAAFTAGALVMRARERFAVLNIFPNAFAIIKNA